MCVSQLLAIIDFFTATSTAGSSIDIGLAIFKGACIGLRDRTTNDFSSVSLRHSLDSKNSPHDGRRQEQGARASTLRLSRMLLSIVVLKQRKSMSNHPPSKMRQFGTKGHSSSCYHRNVHDNRYDDIELQAYAIDRQVDTSSTLQANVQEPNPALNLDLPFNLSPQTFMGFSVAGDEQAQGPIYNYARVWTHTNAIDRISESFLTLTRRQQQQETVDGREWEHDPNRWNEILRGTPEQMSRYLSLLHENR